MEKNLVIWIIEDDEDTVSLIKEQLEDENYSLLNAENGQMAILKFGEVAPDIILMDIMMPHLDGLEATRYFKLKFKKTYVPVIFLTAKDDPETFRVGIDRGCDDYITKPYEVSRLKGSIQLLLPLIDLERKQGENPSAPNKKALIAHRLKAAQHFLQIQEPNIAAIHARKILEMDPDHAEAKAIFMDMKKG